MIIGFLPDSRRAKGKQKFEVQSRFQQLGKGHIVSSGKEARFIDQYLN